MVTWIIPLKSTDQDQGQMLSTHITEHSKKLPYLIESHIGPQKKITNVKVLILQLVLSCVGSLPVINFMDVVKTVLFFSAGDSVLKCPFHGVWDCSFPPRETFQPFFHCKEVYRGLEKVQQCTVTPHCIGHVVFDEAAVATITAHQQEEVGVCLKKLKGYSARSPTTYGIILTTNAQNWNSHFINVS